MSMPTFNINKNLKVYLCHFQSGNTLDEKISLPDDAIYLKTNIFLDTKEVNLKNSECAKLNFPT
jgi:hypothetical protein